MNKTCRKWTIATLALALAGLLVFALPTIILDPLFHYHGPLAGWEYRISDERYQNDGIVKHFTYDALITGTSMTQNFKTSEFDALWGTNGIKVPFSGGGYKEIGSNLVRAIDANDDLAIVLWGLDTGNVNRDKDWSRYDSYPDYLYDDNLLNDVEYVLNKKILFEYTYSYVYAYTKGGAKTTTFDKYNNWMAGRTFGREAVLGGYTHHERSKEEWPFDDVARQRVRENLEQNVIPVVTKNEDITFYLFFTPYSIGYWDQLASGGGIEKQIQAMQYATELLLPYDNVQLYDFYDEYDMICDLDNYKDVLHYHEDINSKMLVWMRNDEHRLTEENYKAHFAELLEFYNNYDYETLAS